MKTGNKPRTISQNRAFHLYCKQLADECLAHGVTLKVIMDLVQMHGIYANEKNIKEMFQSLGKTKYKKSHTSDFTRLELQDIYTTIRNALIPANIYTEFPSYETLNEQQFYDKNYNSEN